MARLFGEAWLCAVTAWFVVAGWFAVAKRFEMAWGSTVGSGFGMPR